VYPDADLNEAVRYTIISIFRFLSGQVCSAGDRLIIHEDIHDEFVKKLVEETKQLTVGPGIEDPAVGPIISEVQYENVLDTIEAAKAEIGDPVIGGEVTNRSGFFIEPTIFTGVTRDSALACEETFGPVLSVLTFSDEKEAIEIANDTEYGLVAGVFTSSIDRANRFAKEVQAGQIYINQWYGGGEETPFGGYKNSGMGREKGLEAMRTYTQVKNVYMKVEDAIESDDATAFR
jgi:aldehyde dehydrogenase (NAD+)